MTSASELAELAAAACRAGRSAGLDAVGIATAEPFEDTRAHLEDRRSRGLHGGMQFTYRNPARSTDPARSLPGAASLVVAARRYARLPPRAATRGGGDGRVEAGPPARVARYSWVDHYRPLREALEACAGVLREAGWQARVAVDDNALVDRAAAQRAGLGWFGKNTNILLPGAGSWFVLGSVITDAPLPSNEGVVPDGCGSCARCVSACPTGALDHPGELDARRCLAWLVQAPGVFPLDQREALGDRLYGCDDCQEACPVNRLAARRDPPPPAEAEACAEVDALSVLDASDADLLERFGRWYIPRREPRYLRRNALLVLGNSADPAAAGVRRAVRRALADPDPLLRGHAVWAARRLGYDDLAGPMAADPDPQVAAEADPSRPVRSRGAGRPPPAARSVSG